MSDINVGRFEPIAISAESTVVAEFEFDDSTNGSYQSEAELESEFINQLKSQAYEFVTISSEEDLISNLRRQLEILNTFEFSDQEWDRFFRDKVSSANDGILEKTERIQEDEIQVLVRDDGTSKNIRLLDKKNIHNNRLQVINQYEVDLSLIHI